MTTVMPPSVFNEQRGLRGALAYVKTVDKPNSGGGVQGTDNEVRSAFARLDEFMADGQQASTEGSLKVALALLKKDLTKTGIEAIFARFEIKPPDPVVDPDDPNVIRPRYGLFETARPIIDRVDAGRASEEDVARLHILKAIADRTSEEPRRVRGRAAFNQPVGMRALGGAGGMQEVGSLIGDAIARARAQ